MPVKREDRRVVFFRVGRALLEIKRKEGETLGGNLALILSAGETQELKQLPPKLGAETVVGQNRIKKVEFLRLNVGVAHMRKKWRDGQKLFGLLLLTVEKWAGSFRPLSRIERQGEPVKKRPDSGISSCAQRFNLAEHQAQPAEPGVFSEFYGDVGRHLLPENTRSEIGGVKLDGGIPVTLSARVQRQLSFALT